MSHTITTQNVNFKVFRFNADEDYLPYYEDYKMEVTSEEVVLDILDRIKWDHDGSFSYRRSCRHGICGACAIKVNGRSTLACKESMNDLIELFGAELTIEPQDIKRAYKDMVIDKENFWNKYNSVQPYLVADIDEFPTEENVMTCHELEQIDEADYCIQCGACFYSCPAVEVNPNYVGPAALVKAWRFNSDVRDTACDSRLEDLQTLGSGIWDCVKCNECAQACPKELNPIDKITKLHQQTFQREKHLKNVAV